MGEDDRPAPDQPAASEPTPDRPAELPPVTAPPAPYQRPQLPFAQQAQHDVDPASVRPSRRWFLAPGLIAGFVLLLLAIVVAAKWSELRAYNDESWIGPLNQGVPISAHTDQRYVIYTYSANVTAPSDCTLRGEDGRQQEAPIDTERGWLDGDTQSDPDGERVFWLGAVVSGLDGEAVLTCPETEERAWVHADSRVIGVVGLAALVCILGLLLALGLTIVIAVLRARDRRGRRLAQQAGNVAG